MMVNDQVILGAMILQSLYINATSSQATIQVVQQPMQGTYIGDLILPPGENPFIVVHNID